MSIGALLHRAVPALALAATVLGCQPSPNVQTGDMTGPLSLLVEKAIAPAEEAKSANPKAAAQKGRAEIAPKATPKATRAKASEQPVAVAHPEQQPLPWSIGHHITF